MPRAPHELNDARVTLRAGACMVFDAVSALDGLVWSVDPTTGLADVEFGDPGTRAAVRGLVAVADLEVSTERLYHVVSITNARGAEYPDADKKVYLTRTPVTRRAGSTIISKCTPRKNTRVQVEDASSAAPITRDGTLESEADEEDMTTPAAPFIEAISCAIRNGGVSFDTNVIAHCASEHVFPFVGTIDIDAIYRDPR